MRVVTTVCQHVYYDLVQKIVEHVAKPMKSLEKRAEMLCWTTKHFPKTERERLVGRHVLQPLVVS